MLIKIFITYKASAPVVMYYLKHTQIASVLNSFKNDPFYTHLHTSLRVFYHI